MYIHARVVSGVVCLYTSNVIMYAETKLQDYMHMYDTGFALCHMNSSFARVTSLFFVPRLAIKTYKQHLNKTQSGPT